MPSLELTDEQALRLWEQLPEEQKKRVMAHVAQSSPVASKLRRQAGSGKDAVRYIAPDFYEPAEGFEDYQ